MKTTKHEPSEMVWKIVDSCSPACQADRPLTPRRVHLTRKLADRVDGVDLVDRREGDTFDLPDPEAELLVAEGWATRSVDLRECSFALSGADAVDLARRVTRQVDQHDGEPQPHRRFEDRVLDELREQREQVVGSLRS